MLFSIDRIGTLLYKSRFLLWKMWAEYLLQERVYKVRRADAIPESLYDDCVVSCWVCL
jgi:hypothetical protein